MGRKESQSNGEALNIFTMSRRTLINTEMYINYQVTKVKKQMMEKTQKRKVIGNEKGIGMLHGINYP
jgi:hypothetical protein